MSAKPTKPCPTCGRAMHRKWAGSFYMFPGCSPHCSWDWVCLCGHIETGGVENGLLLDEMRAVRALNQETAI